MRKVVCAIWPALPLGPETDPVALLAQAGGTPAMAATVPQPHLTLARFVEAAAMLLGLALIGTTAQQLPSHVAWFSTSDRHGPDRGVRDRVHALVRLSALPLDLPPWPPGPRDDEIAWRQVSGEELRRIAADDRASDEAVAYARAELARRGAA